MKNRVGLWKFWSLLLKVSLAATRTNFHAENGQPQGLRYNSVCSCYCSSFYSRKLSVAFVFNSLSFKKSMYYHFFLFKVRRSWVKSSGLFCLVQIPVNVFPDNSHPRGILGPLPKHFILMFSFNYKEQEEWRPFVEGRLAVSSGAGAVTAKDGCAETGRVLHPCWSLLLAVSSQQSQPLKGTGGKRGRSIWSPDMQHQHHLEPARNADSWAPPQINKVRNSGAETQESV